MIRSLLQQQYVLSTIPPSQLHRCLHLFNDTNLLYILLYSTCIMRR